MPETWRRLRDARERAGLTIEEISARTKITVSALHALEDGRFERLPGDFYTRAFLKTYAREVGLPPDDILRDYEAIQEASAPVIEPPVPVKPIPAAQPIPSPPAAYLPRLAEPAAFPWRPSSGWLAVTAAIVLLVALTAMRRPADRPAPPAAAVATSGAVAATPQPTATTGRTLASSEKLTIEIRPSAPIWVAATADGASAIYRLLKPGERVVVEADKELSFRIGNAGAFVYTLNGAAGRPLGGPDEVREFDITRENYRTYLR